MSTLSALRSSLRRGIGPVSDEPAMALRHEGKTPPAPSPPLQRIEVGPADAPEEKEAERVASSVASGRTSDGAARREKTVSTPDIPKEQLRRQPGAEVKEPTTEKVGALRGASDISDESVARIARQEEQEPPVQTSRRTVEPGSPAMTQQRPESNQPESARAARAPEASARGGPVSDAALAQRIASPEGGRPLPESTRRQMESSFGRDFSAVRVHDTAQDQADAAAIGARAFARGNDVTLGAGESASDTRLMAHELAHVVQQTSGRLMREEDTQASAQAATPVGEIDTTAKTITLPVLNLPSFKKDTLPPGTTFQKTARSNRHIEEWENAAAGGNVLNRLAQMLHLNTPANLDSDAEPRFLETNVGEQVVAGTARTLKEKVLRPFWDAAGTPYYYHVDHVRELQIGGADPDINNLTLLDPQTNQASGRAILANLRSAVRQVVKSHKDAGLLTSEPPGTDAVLSEYMITANDVQPGPTMQPRSTLALSQVQSGVHLSGISVYRPVDRMDLTGEPGKVVVVYTNRTGGSHRPIPIEGERPKPFNRTYGPSFEILDVHAPQAGPITVMPRVFASRQGKYKDLKTLDLSPIALKELPGVIFGGYISAQDLRDQIRGLQPELFGASPLSFDELELREDGLFGGGRVRPDAPLIRDANIELVLNGSDVYLSKVFEAGEFSFPGPIRVSDSSMEIVLGSQGLGVNGEVNFEVQNLGTGKLGGRASTGGGEGGGPGFALYGEFNFDSNLFDPAEVTAKYENEQFSASGALGIKPDTIRGIKSASINASVEGERWQADGTIEPDIPGLKQGALALRYDPATGMQVGGTLEFSEEVPGIKGGSVEATLVKREGEEWSLSAAGQAQLDIPGVDASVSAEYSDGAFTAQGTVSYEKGMLSGTITAGASNRTLDEQGQPTGEPGRQLVAFGSGAVTIQIAPWLQGTVGVRLLPNGEVELSGEVALPDTLDLFPEKRYDKNLLSIGLDIPIVGVAVAGQRIGIFANITGGLDVSAGIGPGQLRELSLGITYNPSREQETRVTGGAEFVVPASAGLRLFVRGGLGAGIPIVSAQAGLEIGGELGLEGEAKAGVQVEWTPTTGLILDAEGEITVEPKFRFDVTGFVLVEADLWVSTIELYSQRWRLAGLEFGSGLQFGIRFPIHYEQGQPFDLSLDDIEFITPEIQPRQLLEGLIEQIA